MKVCLRNNLFLRWALFSSSPGGRGPREKITNVYINSKKIFFLFPNPEKWFQPLRKRKSAGDKKLRTLPNISQIFVICLKFQDHAIMHVMACLMLRIESKFRSLRRWESYFYRTQVSLGSDLWVLMSLCHSYNTFLKLNWCDSGWWLYQLNTSWCC